MDKKPLIGVSICAVVLLVLGSLSNVVGFQTVQSSNQEVLNDKFDEKELLFKIIVDIANNKEIQKILLKSQINREGFFNSDIRFSIFNTPVLTKNQIKHVYLIGLILLKFISKSKIHSFTEQYQVNNLSMEKEITAVIEKDTTLKGELMQLSDSECDCENDSTTVWPFPVICSLLLSLFIAFEFCAIYHFEPIILIILIIGVKLNCAWAPHIP
jgi:uncharacterized membrane protein